MRGRRSSQRPMLTIDEPPFSEGGELSAAFTISLAWSMAASTALSLAFATLLRSGVPANGSSVLVCSVSRAVLLKASSSSTNMAAADRVTWSYSVHASRSSSDSTEPTCGAARLWRERKPQLFLRGGRPTAVRSTGLVEPTSMAATTKKTRQQGGGGE